MIATQMRRVVLALVAMAGLTAVASGCAASGDEAKAAPSLSGAYDQCVAGTDLGVRGRIKLVSDDEIQVQGAADSADFSALGCVFRELDTPKSLVADLSVATAQSGSDSLDAGGLHYAWSIQVDGIVTSYPALHMSITRI